MGRLAIFVDGAHIDFLLRDEFGGPRLDYSAFSEAIRAEIARRSADPVDLLRTYYYHCLPYQGNPPTQEERHRYSQMRKFLDALDRLPRFQVRQGRLVPRGTDAVGRRLFIQKQVDLMLGLDLALLCAKGQVNYVALVSGDSDFVPACLVARQEGVAVWLVHGPSRGAKQGTPTYHQQLWVAADERIEITPAFIAAASATIQSLEGP